MLVNERDPGKRLALTATQFMPIYGHRGETLPFIVKIIEETGDGFSQSDAELVRHITTETPEALIV